jgi:hypothetical protein
VNRNKKVRGEIPLTCSLRRNEQILK